MIDAIRQLHHLLFSAIKAAKLNRSSTLQYVLAVCCLSVKGDEILTFLTKYLVFTLATTCRQIARSRSLI